MKKIISRQYEIINNLLARRYLTLLMALVAAILVIIINQLGVFKESATIDFYLSFFIYIVFYAFVAYKLLLFFARQIMIYQKLVCFIFSCNAGNRFFD